MKRSIFLFLLFTSSATFAQNNNNADGSGTVILNNDKIEVVQYIGQPQENVCGIGKHHHDAHLTVALTDGKVLITLPDGKQQTVEIPAGAAIWFNAGTHSVINEGKSKTNFLLVYLKEK